MEQLNFHITVHNPWRPVEGLIIDIKTRLLPNLPGGKMDVEKFRVEIEKFLDDVVALTNASLIYAPSQVIWRFSHYNSIDANYLHIYMAVFLKIALAAVIHGASKNGHNLDTYVTEVLFVGEKDDEDVKQQKLGKIIEAVRSKFY